MKPAIFNSTTLFFFILFFITSSVGFAQSTFKVVCDKTDNTIKVVETENRSPNYVPIKGGFPFRQVAQKWIDENYTTTSCNSDQIIEQNKQQENKAAPSPSNSFPQQRSQPSTTSTPAPTHTILQPSRSGSNSAIKYRNTSFLANARFSNLGEAFLLSEKLMPGFEAGIEQLFGKQLYFGTGINMDFYFSNFDDDNNLEDGSETIYFFKIPAFIGYRTVTKKIMVMYEAGAALNTKFIGTPLVLESFGQTANKSSFDFLARLKVGSEKVMLELGADIWLTEVFENDSYKMTSVYVGLRFNF